jgi:hypothetical protein
MERSAARALNCPTVSMNLSSEDRRRAARNAAGILNWVSIPALLSLMFSASAWGYGLVPYLALCLGAAVLVHRKLWSHELVSGRIRRLPLGLHQHHNLRRRVGGVPASISARSVF